VEVILDTNAVSALLSGDADLAHVLEPSERHHLPVIVIGEYRYGLDRSLHREALNAFLETLISESIVLRVDESGSQRSPDSTASRLSAVTTISTPSPAPSGWHGEYRAPGVKRARTLGCP